MKQINQLIGIIAAGIGESQLNTLLSVMNLPSITSKSLKKCEREAGSHIIKVTSQSCEEALSMEMEMEKKR